MKAIYKKTLIVLIAIFLGFLSFKIISKVIHKKQIASAIKTMPDFQFVDINYKNFSNDNLDKTKSTILINFSSECPHCQFEASSIQKNINLFNNFELLFISSEPIDTIKKFAKTYQLDNLNNVFFLFDEKDTFSPTFDMFVIPALVVYDKNNQLVLKHKGQIKADKILEMIKRKNERD